jgi:hypothetical protein
VWLFTVFDVVLSNTSVLEFEDPIGSCGHGFVIWKVTLSQRSGTRILHLVVCEFFVACGGFQVYRSKKVTKTHLSIF